MNEKDMTQTASWWKTGVIYQVYPRSFKDSNSDGIGDLAGITQRLDYLRWLGVDALWLSPIYPSPMADFGYDISNYTGVHPLFGTLQDLDTLVQQAHLRDLKVILDFVPNHTSDEHPWFQESRGSRENEKRDWYLWRDPAPGGGPPNNWTSMFGGSAWQFDPRTGQYYLHLFDVKQPDLNWRNPQVRRAMYDVLRFWLERGIDGFRVDVMSLLLKDSELRDNEMNPLWKPGDPPYMRQKMQYNDDLPEIHEIVREMRAVLDGYDDRVLIGELYLPVPRLMRYYGQQLDEAHLPFNFQLVTMPGWEARAIRELVDSYEAALPSGAWPNWVLGNHDKSRIATRVGRDQARLAQMLLLTLRGTPTCYYGDEIGMEDVAIPLEQIQDPQGRDDPRHSRDPQRTPMQWDTSANAGFCSPDVQPWLPVAGDYQHFNVVEEQQDPRSMLMLTRALLERRRIYDALTAGDYRSVEQDNPTCFVYERHYHERRCLIALNFSEDEQVVALPYSEGRIVLSTYMDMDGANERELSALCLRPNEGVLMEVGSN